jgi:hypothetical protein
VRPCCAVPADRRADEGIAKVMRGVPDRPRSAGERLVTTARDAHHQAVVHSLGAQC